MGFTDTFRKFLSRDPKTSSDWIQRGDVLAQQNLLEDALESYSRALVLDPGHLSALRGKASVERRMGDLHTAIGTYSVILAEVPGDIRTLLELGYTYTLNGDARNAVRQYDRVLEMDPSNTAAVALRFFTLSKHVPEAQWKDLIRETEASHPGLFMQAMQLTVLDMIKYEILGIPQGNKLLLIGDTSYVSGDIRELENALPRIKEAAETVLQNCSQFSSRDPAGSGRTPVSPALASSFDVNLGELERWRSWQPADAKKSWEKGDLLCKGADRIHTLADTEREDIFREAMLSFDHVLASAPGQELATLAWLGKGFIAMRQAHFTDALTFFEQAMLLSPRNPACLKGKAHALSNLSRADEASRCFDEAQKIKDASDPHNILWITDSKRGYIMSRLLS